MRQRHQRQPLAGDRAVQLVDLARLQQQLARRRRGSWFDPAAVAVLRDDGVDQPDFLALDRRIAFGDRALAGAQRLHLGARAARSRPRTAPRRNNRTARAGSRRRPWPCRTGLERLACGVGPSKADQIKPGMGQRRIDRRLATPPTARSSAGAARPGSRADLRQRIFDRARRGVAEQRGVERVEPVLELERLVPAALAHRLLELGAQPAARHWR